MAKTPSPNSVQSYAVGLNRGYIVTKLKKKTRGVSKGVSGERGRAVRRLVRSVVGLSSFEKRVLEMFRAGVTKVEKRAFKLLKRRLGSRSRALKKQEELNTVIKNLAKKA